MQKCMDVNVSSGISVEIIIVSDAFPQDHIAKYTYTKGPVGPVIIE
jgi:hypothetical protein